MLQSSKRENKHVTKKKIFQVLICNDKNKIGQYFSNQGAAFYIDLLAKGFLRYQLNGNKVIESKNLKSA